ncbi:hypothetical protein [uncultured Mediterranean phage uvMED]|nr:hypothetical protein [uncultured Mediterranean phage uvMED]BAR18188.1 hypothetical protein [uncultured Mediterranean phage uvMED]
MALVKYNDNSISAVTSTALAEGSLVPIKTLNASSSSTLSFVHGSSDVVLDSTYPIYMFKFINIHPSYNGADLKVGFRDGGTDYDATKTTTYFSAYHNEAGNDSGLAYDTGEDLAQLTNFQNICKSIGNGNDENGNGFLYLFNPSSTTFVKHFMSNAVSNEASDYILNIYTAGYCNVTSAIDGVQFSMNTGTIDSGTIKLYGIKDS